MRKGASLVWVLIISTALLFISVTTANFVIKESQMSVRMDDSSRAYAAAESGIDWGKYCVENLNECKSLTYLPSSSTSPYVFSIGTSKYTVTVTRSMVAGKQQTKVVSLGTSTSVNRKLEYIIAPGKTLVTPANLSTPLVSKGSYVQQFDYWTDGGATSQIGIGNIGGSTGIYFEHYLDSSDGNAPKFRLGAKRNGSTPIVSEGIDLGSVDISEPFAIRVRIEYFQDLSAKLTISRRNDDGFECLPSPVGLDLRGLVFAPTTDFTRFYFSSASVPTATSAELGYGNGYKFVSGASIVYFDNLQTYGL